MSIVYKFILFALLFNVSAFFIASTSWFPNCLGGDAMSDISLDDPASLSTSEDVFLRMIENDAGTNFIADRLGLDAVGTFYALIIGFIGGSVILGWLSKGSGMQIVGMSIVAFLYYILFMNSKGFVIRLLDNFPDQVNYIVIMIGISMLFMFIILIGDYASGQRRSA